MSGTLEILCLCNTKTRAEEILENSIFVFGNLTKGASVYAYIFWKRTRSSCSIRNTGNKIYFYLLIRRIYYPYARILWIRCQIRNFYFVLIVTCGIYFELWTYLRKSLHDNFWIFFRNDLIYEIRNSDKTFKVFLKDLKKKNKQTKCLEFYVNVSR